MTGDYPLLRAVRGCPAVEVVWAQAGQLRVRSEPAVVEGGQVVVLLTADAAEDAASVAGARTVVVAATDRRGTPPGWQPAAATASASVERLTQAWVDGPLLPALVHRDPVARTLVGSLLARREHWWAVPRHVLRLRPVAPTDPPPARTDEALIVGCVGGQARVLGVAGLVDEHDAVRLQPRGHVVPVPDGAPALAVRTAPPSVPGADRVQVLHGRLEGRRLVAVQWHGRVDDAPERLLSRWRSERALARACRAALRDWHDPSGG